jgi:hypothetical protein
MPTTYRYNNTYLYSNFSILYGGGYGATGGDVYDVLSVGGATIPQYRFGGVDTKKFQGSLATLDIMPEIQGTPIESSTIPHPKVTLADSNGVRVTLTGGATAGWLIFRHSLPMPSTMLLAPIVDCSLVLTSTTLNLLFQGITIAIPIGQLIVPNSACSSCQLGLSINSSTSFPGGNTLSSM